MKKIYLKPEIEIAMLLTSHVMNLPVVSGESGGQGGGDPSLAPQRKVF